MKPCNLLGKLAQTDKVRPAKYVGEFLEGSGADKEAVAAQNVDLELRLTIAQDARRMFFK